MVYDEGSIRVSSVAGANVANHLATIARTANKLSDMLGAFARHHTSQQSLSPELISAIDAAGYVLPRLETKAKEAVRERRPAGSKPQNRRS